MRCLVHNALGFPLMIRCALAALVALSALPAAAGTMSEREVQIAAKTLSYLKAERIEGRSIVIVDGAADLEAVKRAFPSATVSPEKSLASENVSIAFVNNSASAQSINEGVLTVTSDVNCVDQGRCVLGIRLNPKVRIYLNREAAAKADAVFDPSLMMLITLRGGASP